MVLYVSGEKEARVLKDALGHYFACHAKNEQADTVAKILARVIVCECKQGKEKAATPKDSD